MERASLMYAMRALIETSGDGTAPVLVMAMTVMLWSSVLMVGCALWQALRHGALQRAGAPRRFRLDSGSFIKD